jgi:steroid delta-isomerase-like uncharacterized protein
MRTDQRADPIAVVRRCFEDIIVRGELGVADEVLSEDVRFTTVNGDVLTGRRAFKNFADQFRTAFPDISFDFEEEFTDGERVCTRYLMGGTFLSTLLGVVPNGNEFQVRGIDTFRVIDGKVVEIFASFDTLGQMRQLGIVRV